MGAQIERVDLARAADGDAHDHQIAVGRESRREGHAGKIAQHFLLAGVDVEDIDPRRAARVGEIGDLLRRGREARRQHQCAPVGQIAVIGAVLIHDGKALDPVVLRAALGDVDDAGVEITFLAGDALINLVGDNVGDAPPIRRRSRIAQAGELLLGIDVPQAEFDLQLAVGAGGHGARHQRLGVDDAPIGVARRHLRCRVLVGEGLRVDRLEQARPLEIGRDDLVHVLRYLRVVAGKDRDGDRHRRDLALRDVDMELGMGGQRGHEQSCDEHEQARQVTTDHDAHH